nr:hypothetical protein Iba_chr08fCG3010 [Ipomoea batatas]
MGEVIHHHYCDHRFSYINLNGRYIQFQRCSHLHQDRFDRIFSVVFHRNVREFNYWDTAISVTRIVFLVRIDCNLLIERVGFFHPCRGIIFKVRGVNRNFHKGSFEMLEAFHCPSTTVDTPSHPSAGGWRRRLLNFHRSA